MTKEEKQAITKRITELQKQQVGLKNESGQLHQAIAEVKEAFNQLQARIEELRNIINPKGGQDAPPSI